MLSPLERVTGHVGWCGTRVGRADVQVDREERIEAASIRSSHPRTEPISKADYIPGVEGGGGIKGEIASFKLMGVFRLGRKVHTTKHFSHTTSPPDFDLSLTSDFDNLV